MPLTSREPLATSLSVAAIALACAAFLGLVDVGLHGAGLDIGAAVATVGLWLALGVAPAVGLGLAAGALSRTLRSRPVSARAARATPARLPLERIAALCLGIVLLSGLLAAGFAAARFEPLALPWRAATPTPDEPSVTRPNVVLIVLDTLRADHLGAYGHPDDPTPVFDGLAEQGLLFEHCFAPAAWTVPSHASLFTGLFPTSHGASFEHARRLDDRFTTLAEWLRDGGHRTAAFVANPQLALANLDQGFELYREVTAPFARLTLRKPLTALGGPARWIDEGGAQATRDIADFFDARSRSSTAAPLFLFVNLLEPHWRHLPPFRERRDALADTGGYWAGTASSTRFYGPLAMARGGLENPHDLATLRALYLAEVRYQDALLGRLIEHVDQHLAPERTLLIVTADHGENLGEGARFDHVFALNDHLIRVPMLLRQPGRIAPGSRSDAPCQLVDVAATIREMPGMARPDDVGVGHDLLAAAQTSHRLAYAEGDPYLDHLERMAAAAGEDFDPTRFATPLRAVRDERYKLVWAQGEAASLYDLAADPDELHDVGDEYPARRAALREAFDQWSARQPPFATAAAAAAGEEPVGEATRERLEALGYAP